MDDLYFIVKVMVAVAFYNLFYGFAKVLLKGLLPDLYDGGSE